jgi:predicted esterase
MRLLSLIPLVLLAACGQDDPKKPHDDDTGETGQQDTLPSPAPLTALTDGECPDLSASGLSTFSSGGSERTATVVIPTEPTAGMPVVFFFHGLVGTSPEPTGYLAEGLDLQAVADDQGAIFVLPQSRTMTYFGQTFHMWQVWDEDDLDLRLYDDLRTCVVEGLEADISRVAAMGFSGGALFTTVVARERGDTLASMVEMSGGSDVDFQYVSEDPLAAYGPPANAALPALLVSGGDQDGWPQGFIVVDFQEATDRLQAHLLEDGYYLWRCRHDQGHTITMTEWALAKEWALAHTYGGEAVFSDGRIDDYASWCEVPTLGEDP